MDGNPEGKNCLPARLFFGREKSFLGAIASRCRVWPDAPFRSNIANAVKLRVFSQSTSLLHDLRVCP